MPPPRLVLLDRPLPEAELLDEAFSEQAGRRVSVRAPQRGEQARMIRQARRNAEEELDRRLAETCTQARNLRELAELFELPEPPQRIEVYDNSHVMGTNAVGAMIVAGPEGFRKNAYRKFNIKRPETVPGDDFAMMREVLGRRFARLEKEDPDRSRGDWPDLLLIDGGKGQLSRGLRGARGCRRPRRAGGRVSKGPDRNAGREVFHLPGGREVTLPPNSPLLFYLQRLRDEAHRFAIGAHRQKRAKSMAASPLDEVPGIGPGRKRALLMHFGTARAVKAAALEDLEKVPGISRATARGDLRLFPPGRLMRLETEAVVVAVRAAWRAWRDRPRPDPERRRPGRLCPRRPFAPASAGARARQPRPRRISRPKRGAARASRPSSSSIAAPSCSPSRSPPPASNGPAR